MKITLTTLIILSSILFYSQSILPISSTNYESSKESINNYRNQFKTLNSDVITSAPVGNLRTMGEWEEQQAVCITWTGYKSILAQIAQEIQSECEVIILCNDSNSTKNELIKAVIEYIEDRIRNSNSNSNSNT